MPQLAAQLNQLADADVNQVIAICGADAYVATNAPKRQKIAELLTWVGGNPVRSAQVDAAIAQVVAASPDTPQPPPPPARSRRPLTLQDMAAGGFLNALIVAYPDEPSATTLVLAVGFLRHMIPPFSDARVFWLDVCEKIANGAPPGAFEPLLAQAAEDYSSNPLFAPYKMR